MEDTSLQQAYRPLQQAAQGIQHQSHLHHTLTAQGGLDLSLDNDPFQHAFQSPHPFDRNHGGQMHIPNDDPHTPQQLNGNGQYGVLTAGPVQHNAINRLQEEDIFGNPESGDQKSNGHLSTKIVPDPPNLAEWRQKLFNVDEMITLSEDE
jgi:glutathione S-transferase